MQRQNYLDNNVLSDGVLIRLSARKLQSMKFICTEWQGLISDRSFIRSHLKNREPLSGFFFQEKYQRYTQDVDRVNYISIEPVGVHTTVLDFLPERVVLLASCNGLLCCRSILPSPEPKLFVCNPLNKEWTSLEWKTCDRNASAALVFDPIHPFDGASTNYHIVVVARATGTSGEPLFGFDIYSSTTRNWRRSGEKCERKRDIYKNKGIYVDGVLYWLTYGDHILMFDLKNEISMLIRMPIPLADLDFRAEMCIGESGGKLCYVLLSSRRLQLWILEDEYESHWDLAVSVDNLEKYGFTATSIKNWRFSDRGEDTMDLLNFKDGVLGIRYLSAIYSFEFETRTVKKLCRLDQLGTLGLNGPTVLSYSMSLAPLP